MRRQLYIVVFTFALVWHGMAMARSADESSESKATSRTLTGTSAAGNGGWHLGFGAFAGNGLESGSEVASGMGVQFGRMMTPTFAWLVDGHGAAVGRSDLDTGDISSTILTQAIVAGAVQWWPSRRVWLRGGVGPGRVSGITASIGLAPSADLDETRYGMGATVAAGFEVYRGRRFALDVHARYAGIRADGHTFSSLVGGLGFAWHTNPQPRSIIPDAAITEPKVRTGRGRWMLGVGALAGRPINNDGTDSYWDAGAGADFQVGWMAIPRFALLMDTHAIAVGESQIENIDAENNALVQGVVAFGAQYWTTPRLWIRAGIGRGEVRASATVSASSVDIVETQSGFGSLAAVGYELYQGKSLGVSTHARYAGIHGDQLNRASVVLGIGLTWYP